MWQGEGLDMRKELVCPGHAGQFYACVCMFNIHGGCTDVVNTLWFGRDAINDTTFPKEGGQALRSNWE